MFFSSKDGEKPPWLLRLRSSTGFIAATVWMSNFTVRIPWLVLNLLTRKGLLSLCLSKSDSQLLTSTNATDCTGHAVRID